jgi:pyrroline-5-carboxylate reductase
MELNLVMILPGSPKKVGFIGVGRMGGAMLSGVINAGSVSSIWAAVRSEESRKKVSSTFSIPVYFDYAKELASTEVLFLGTEPGQIKDVCNYVSTSLLPSDAIVVSVAAGVSTQMLNEYLDGKYSIVRVMPNLACKFGEGVLLVCSGPRSSNGTLGTIITLLSPLGLCLTIDENQINIGTALTASGPAFIFLFIHALMEVALDSGISHESARIAILQTCKGALTVLENTGESPKVLIEKITTPGGCTLAGLKSLDEANFSDIVKSAILTTEKRAKDLGVNEGT